MKHWNKIDWLFLSSVCEPFFVFRYVWGDKKLKLQDRSTNYVKTKARWTRLPTRILSMLTWICYKISLGTPKIFQNSAIHICTICIHHLILGIFAIFAKPFWLPIENSTCQNIKKNHNGFWRLQKLWLATNPTYFIHILNRFLFGWNFPSQAKWGCLWPCEARMNLNNVRFNSNLDFLSNALIYTGKIFLFGRYCQLDVHRLTCTTQNNYKSRIYITFCILLK